MPRVELARAAIEDLDALIESHELPADTTARVSRSLRTLEHFPRAGRALDAPWTGYRFLIGPWRWMLVVYEYVETEDRATVVTIQDGRTSTSPTRAD